MTREAMIRLIRAPFETAISAMPANSRGGSANGLLSTISSSGPLDAASWPVGTTIDAVKVDQQVDDAGGEQATEERARVDPARMPHLLGHVDRVIEADQGVEREN